MILVQDLIAQPKEDNFVVAKQDLVEFTSKIKTDLVGTMKNEVERDKELKLEMAGLEGCQVGDKNAG